jgi:hypothetical protein
MTVASHILGGIALLAIVTVEFGGYFMTRIVRGLVAMTDFQKSFARAGHAHAGVLVSLALICQIFADATALEGPLASLARSGVPLAAILIPAGYFFSSAGRGATEPNRLIVLIYVGAVSLALGVVALGIGLLT